MCSTSSPPGKSSCTIGSYASACAYAVSSSASVSQRKACRSGGAGTRSGRRAPRARESPSRAPTREPRHPTRMARHRNATPAASAASSCRPCSGSARARPTKGTDRGSARRLLLSARDSVQPHVVRREDRSRGRSASPSSTTRTTNPSSSAPASGARTGSAYRDRNPSAQGRGRRPPPALPRPSERSAASPFTQPTSTTTAGGRPLDRAAVPASAGSSRASRHEAVHLIALRVLAIHVHAVHAGEVPHVLGIRVTPVLLRRVAGERRALALDMALLEGDVGAVQEVEVVPRDLVPEVVVRLNARRPSCAIVWWSWWTSWCEGWKTTSGFHSSHSATSSSRMSCRRSGNVRTSKSCTVRCSSPRPSSAVAWRTSRASVSGSKPSGSERVAIENAT